MCYNINLGFCKMHPKRKCCMCIAATHSIKLLPILDFTELVIEVPLLIATFAGQDTWMAHYTLLLIVLMIATIVKLFGAVTIFCAGIPGLSKGVISTWQYKFYWWVRMAAILIFMWGWALNYVLSQVAISSVDYYDDISWGLCSFCYNFATCETEFD